MPRLLQLLVFEPRGDGTLPTRMRGEQPAAAPAATVEGAGNEGGEGADADGPMPVATGGPLVTCAFHQCRE